ncbi:MAG TPA: DUF1549 domain-containing protein, partial [Polyangiaceae bacterium]|nr:DUF1549 domain-containing protein [Polyangiaceae bacterium]
MRPVAQPESFGSWGAARPLGARGAALRGARVCSALVVGTLIFGAAAALTACSSGTPVESARLTTPGEGPGPTASTPDEPVEMGSGGNAGMGGAGNAEEPPDPKEHWSFVPRDTGPVPSFDATEAPPAASTAAPDDTAAPADAGMPSAPASAAPDDSTAPVTTAAPVSTAAPGNTGALVPDGAAWVHNEIDAFILDRLHTLGQHPSPVAEPEKLLRRVTLDLTGL